MTVPTWCLSQQPSLHPLLSREGRRYARRYRAGEWQRLAVPAVPGQRRALAEQAAAGRQHVAGDAGVLVAAAGPAAGLARACGTPRTVEEQGGIGRPFGGAAPALHWPRGKRVLNQTEVLHGAHSLSGFLNTSPAPHPGPGGKGASASTRGAARPAKRLAQPHPLPPGTGCGSPSLPVSGRSSHPPVSCPPAPNCVHNEHSPALTLSPIHSGDTASAGAGTGRSAGFGNSVRDQRILGTNALRLLRGRPGRCQLRPPAGPFRVHPAARRLVPSSVSCV